MPNTEKSAQNRQKYQEKCLLARILIMEDLLCEAEKEHETRVWLSVDHQISKPCTALKVKVKVKSCPTLLLYQNSFKNDGFQGLPHQSSS